MECPETLTAGRRPQVREVRVDDSPLSAGLFHDEAEAPFSWEPEVVEVLPSGTLAHSSGPVKDPQGTVVATFNSVWRLEADGRWRVVFDKGCSAGGE